MIGYLLLACAIITEVAASLSLRIASSGRRRWWCAVVPGYAAALGLLAAVLAQGVALGVAYGIWAAGGVGLTAIASKIVFADTLNRRMLLGVVLITIGVLTIHLGTH